MPLILAVLFFFVAVFMLWRSFAVCGALRGALIVIALMFLFSGLTMAHILVL